MVITFAILVRSVGIFLTFPFIASLLESKKWKLNPFTIFGSLLIFIIPFLALLTYMLYQKQYGTHPTGYVETFFLCDPYDSSKGLLSTAGFVKRTLYHTVNTFIDIGRAVTSSPFSNIVIGSVFSIIAAVTIGGCFLRSQRQMIIILSFIIPYIALILICIWPYKGVRFLLPLIPVATLGVFEIFSFVSDLFPRYVFKGMCILFLCFLGISTVRMVKKANHDHITRTRVHENFNDISRWCRENIPYDDVIASFDYREHSLRLEKAIVPLYYSSDVKQHISSMERNNVDWLIVSYAMSYLRGSYADAIIKHLGDDITLKYENELFKIYQCDKNTILNKR